MFVNYINHIDSLQSSHFKSIMHPENADSEQSCREL